MTEENNNPAETNTENNAEQQAQNEGPIFAVQKIYVKDASFEAPHLPEIFTLEYKPDVKMEMNSKSRPLGDDHFEVVLTVTLSAEVGEKTAFLAEVHQGGLFVLKNMTNEQIEQTLSVQGPETLYPYVRETIASLIGRSGLPAIQLTPVNFVALYIQRKQQEAAAAQQQQDNGEVTVQ